MRVRSIDRALRATVMVGMLGAALHAAAAETAPQPAVPAKVQVQRWQVTGNTLLPAAELDAVLARYAGERSFAELEEAAQAVQALYGAAGYGGVVAYLPVQAVSGGVVSITVVEGKLARVEVQGNQHFSADTVRASLPSLVEGRTPNLRQVDADVRLANENPARQVQVLLRPGERPGQSDARVSVAEQPVQRWSVGADNTGTRRTGRARATLGWQHADVSGHDDVASAQWQTSPEHPDRVNAVSGGYHLPLYGMRSTLDAYAGYSDIDGGNTPTAVGNLQFAGKGRAAGLRMTRHFMRFGEVDSRLALGLDYRAYLNQCAIAGLPAGACGPAGESVSVQPLSLEYAATSSGGAVGWATSVGLQYNLQLGGGLAGDEHFQAVRPGAKPHYTVLRANAELELPLPAGWHVKARAAGQMSEDALVPGEQFGIGGVASVRGYDEREMAGDRGAAASLELIAPDWTPSFAPQGRLSVLGFADGGWIDNTDPTPCLESQVHCHLYGAGFGARWAQGGLRAQLYVAHALSNAITTRRNSNRVHVSVGYTF